MEILSFNQTFTIISISLALIMIMIFLLPFLSYLKFRKTKIPSISSINLKILKKVSENKEKHFKLEEIYSSSSLIYKESLKWLKEKKYVSQNKKGEIKITKKGFEKLYENYKEDSQYNLKRQESLIGILLTILTIVLLYSTLQIQVVQTSIIENSNSPVQATLEFIPDQEDLIFQAWELSNEKDLTKDADERWAKIEITILNFGQMDSNHVHCHNKNQNNFLFGYLQPNSNFQNIPAGSSNRSTLHVRYTECQLEEKEMCSKELVPLGIQNVTLLCECYGCKKQRTFEVPITFCIYNSDKSICDSFQIQ